MGINLEENKEVLKRMKTAARCPIRQPSCLGPTAYCVLDEGHPGDHKMEQEALTTPFDYLLIPESLRNAEKIKRILRDCNVVMELRKLGRFDSADKLEELLK